MRHLSLSKILRLLILHYPDCDPHCINLYNSSHYASYCPTTNYCSKGSNYRTSGADGGGDVLACHLRSFSLFLQLADILGSWYLIHYSDLWDLKLEYPMKRTGWNF